MQAFGRWCARPWAWCGRPPICGRIGENGAAGRLLVRLITLLPHSIRVLKRLAIILTGLLRFLKRLFRFLTRLVSFLTGLFRRLVGAAESSNKPEEDCRIPSEDSVRPSRHLCAHP